MGTTGKSLLAFVLLLWSLAAPSWAFDTWTTGDTVRQAAIFALGAYDWHQTREIASNPERYHEHNPLLGRHPSKHEVDLYFPLAAAFNIGVAYVLPRGWRDAWQYVSIGMESGCVMMNFNIGLGR